MLSHFPTDCSSRLFRADSNTHLAEGFAAHLVRRCGLAAWHTQLLVARPGASS